jgi:hypothetical protein
VLSVRGSWTYFSQFGLSYKQTISVVDNRMVVREAQQRRDLGSVTCDKDGPSELREPAYFEECIAKTMLGNTTAILDCLEGATAGCGLAPAVR